MACFFILLISCEIEVAVSAPQSRDRASPFPMIRERSDILFPSKSFVVEEDDYFLTLARYVEANALRARLVPRAERWRWCGLSRRTDRPFALVDWPVDRPRNWVSLVNEALPQRQVQQIQLSLKRQRPFGEEKWVERIAKKLGMEFTLNPRGRPKKGKE
jgi:putative transposase